MEQKELQQQVNSLNNSYSFFNTYFSGVEIVFFSASVSEDKEVVVNKPFIFVLEVLQQIFDSLYIIYDIDFHFLLGCWEQISNPCWKSSKSNHLIMVTKLHHKILNVIWIKIVCQKIGPYRRICSVHIIAFSQSWSLTFLKSHNLTISQSHTTHYY